MTGSIRLAILAASCAMLHGCVAAVVPIVAAGAMGGRQVLGGKDGRGDAASPPLPAAVMAAPPPEVVAMTVPSAPLPPPAPAPAAPPAVAIAAPVVLPLHGWRDMVTHVAELLQARTRPVDGVVPVPGAPSRFIPCGAKPYAVIVDVDGTLLPSADAAATTLRTDAAARAFGDLRFGHATVIFTSARPAAETAATENALERASLGPAMQGREFLSVADGPAGSSKAALRAAAATEYCVLALVGDEAEDFTDPPAADAVPTAARWGTAWFRIPGQASSK